MKTALISGGTSGVGLSIVKSLLKKNYRVFFIGSNKEKGIAIESELNCFHSSQATFVHLDLSLLHKVRCFTEQFVKENDRLDVLANVAGVLMPKRETTKEGYEKTFTVGYLSAFILSTELMPLLEKSKGRIVNVTCATSASTKAKLDFSDLTFAHQYSGFAVLSATLHAKAVLTNILSEIHPPGDVDIVSFSPGMVKSGLMQRMNAKARFVFRMFSFFMARESKTGIYVAISPDIKGQSGKLFDGKKVVDLTFDNSYKETLWSVTKQLAGTGQ